MPRVVRPKGWNDLSPSQKDQWKKKNFQKKVVVSEKIIQKLRDGGSKAYNVKKYSGTKSAVMREAMNRFYGKGWDKGTTTKPKSSTNKPSSTPKTNPYGPGKIPLPNRPSSPYGPGKIPIPPKKKSNPKSTKPKTTKPKSNKPKTGGLKNPFDNVSL